MNVEWLVIFDALYKVYFDGAYSNLAVNESISRRSECDGAFVRNAVKGTLSRTITLDSIIDRLASKGIKGIKRRPLTVIRMGIYAITYLDSVPDHAAVDQMVSLARKVCKGESGFVNAVLRSFIRDRDRLTDFDSIPDVTERLSVKYSFAPELVRLLIEQYGPEQAEELMEWSNIPAALCVRANTLKCSRGSLAKALEEAGYEVTPDPDTQRGLIISGSDVISSELYKSGLFTVQSSSSIRSIEALSPQPGSVVLDMCAAPGGKSTMMAEMMENKGSVTACDIHEHRLGLISANAARLGTDIITVRASDGTVFDESMQDSFDYVLCDVPCSGLGVIRSKPEIKLGFDDGEINGLINIQRSILMNAYRYTRPGGMFMYSTCTINRSENEGVTGWLISQVPGVHVVEKESSLPYNNKVGFYFCLMQKPDNR